MPIQLEIYGLTLEVVLKCKGIYIKTIKEWCHESAVLKYRES